MAAIRAPIRDLEERNARALRVLEAAQSTAMVIADALEQERELARRLSESHRWIKDSQGNGRDRV